MTMTTVTVTLISSTVTDRALEDNPTVLLQPEPRASCCVMHGVPMSQDCPLEAARKPMFLALHNQQRAIKWPPGSRTEPAYKCCPGTGTERSRESPCSTPTLCPLTGPYLLGTRAHSIFPTCAKISS